ncbi:MAG: hypothetical protein M1828_005603 [Chrysothrix sp. TS-e1954]|nr:MAG: hypothetical protein M1828_005603 [Chrysothrix sp. TS-e1954]
MRAAQYYGKEDLRIEHDVPERECGSGMIKPPATPLTDNPLKIAPAFCGICGMDLHEWSGGPTFAPSPSTPHPVTNEHIPITIGHEFSGTIVELGPDLQDASWEVGENVCVCPSIYCGECVSCRIGAENACDRGGFVGLSGWGGGLSERVVVRERMCVRLPGGVGLEVGALVEPLAVGWHAVDVSAFGEGDRVLVLGGGSSFLRRPPLWRDLSASSRGEISVDAAADLRWGPGPIGLSVVQALVARKASLIITAEVSPNRQSFAKRFGAHHVLDPTKEADLPGRCRELCGGLLPDVVFDCAGVPASIRAACACIRARGQVLNVAIWEKPVPFNPNDLVFKEATFKGVLGYLKKDFEYVVGALKEGRLEPAGMVTKKIGLGELVEEGFRSLVEEKDGQVKILVELDGE